MTNTAYATAVNHNYAPGELDTAIENGLRAAGKDLNALTPDDLAPLDQFHIGSQRTTADLRELAEVRAGMTVLDVGGGLGGPARDLARAVACQVTVLDLTEAYVRAGEKLTARLGVSDRVHFKHGDATHLPFPDASFDRVWTQHVSMNIPDKAALLAEAWRVLRTGGRLALHEILAGPVTPIVYPVPWAGEASLSFVAAPDELRALAAQAGFQERAWVDVSAPAKLGWDERIVALNAPGGPPPLGLHLLLGPSMAARFTNMARNLREDRIVVVQAVYEKA